MRKLLVLIGLVSSSTVWAQPTEPSPTTDPAAMPPPAPSPPPVQPPQPSQSPPAPIQPSAVYQPRPLESYRRGLTFEANVGLGGKFSHDNDSGENSDTKGVGAGSFGVGWFVNPSIAVGLRLTTSVDSDESKDANGVTTTSLGVDAFFGPNVQYWFPNRAWIGGGIGWGRLASTATATSTGNQPVTATFGVDGVAVNARAGYTLTTSSESTWNISIELWSGFYRDDAATLTIDGAPFLEIPVHINTYNFAVLFGYQHL